MGDEWRQQAACRGMSTETFFPGQGEAHGDALAVCAACPVRDECRAAGASERFGIWGGTSERQRRRARALVRWCRVCGLVRVIRVNTACPDCRRRAAAERQRRYRQRQGQAS